MGADQKYIRIVFQYQIIECVEQPEENFLLILSVSDIALDQNTDETVKFRLYNFKTNEIVKFDVFDEEQVSLSPGKIEVLKMVNKGLISKEISN